VVSSFDLVCVAAPLRALRATFPRKREKESRLRELFLVLCPNEPEKARWDNRL